LDEAHFVKSFPVSSLTVREGWIAELLFDWRPFLPLLHQFVMQQVQRYERLDVLK